MTRERCTIEEWLNVPEVSDVSVARAIVAAGITTELHAVKATREIYIIESGSGDVEDGSAEPVSVSVGDIVIIDADSPQRIHNTGQADLVFLCVCTPRFQQHAYEILQEV